MEEEGEEKGWAVVSEGSRWPQGRTRAGVVVVQDGAAVHQRGGMRTAVVRRGVHRRGLEDRQQTAAGVVGVAADVEDDADAGDVDTTWWCVRVCVCSQVVTRFFKKKR